MWLNIVLTSLACLLLGFVVGWVVARPRRWDHYAGDLPVSPENLASWYRMPTSA